MRIVKEDIRRVVGPIQLCAGFESGAEIASVTMQTLFDDDGTEAVLLVDAENAFNSLNRKVALVNILRSCPSLAPALINTYRTEPKLYIQNHTVLSKEGTTQGDPMAMAMYALAIAPLVKKCAGVSTQVWYADDSSAGGTVDSLRSWWERLAEDGPLYGYFPKASKSSVIVKGRYEEKARDAFSGSGLAITTEGSTHLGIPLGTKEYQEQRIREKVSEWCTQIESLSLIASSQPRAAFSTFTHGVVSGWMYFMRLVPLSHEQLQPLEEAIRQKFIPAVSGKCTITNDERDLFALPIREGGMGIPLPHQLSTQQRCLSQDICAPIVKAVLQQQDELDPDLLSEFAKTKSDAVHTLHCKKKSFIESTTSSLPPKLQRQVKIASCDGASSWLSCIPLKVYYFSLHKRAFVDAVSLRYGWYPKDLPTKCDCGKPFSVNHALNCPKGGFPILRHNEVRDLTASLLSDVCHDVNLEPHLQPLSGEIMQLRTAITDNEARADISACGFWGSRYEKTFMDVRVFNPNAESYRNEPIDSCFKRQEQAKRRQYEERIREIEHASFSPLIFSTSAGMSRSTSVFYKRLAHLLSVKKNEPYSCVIRWLRCRLGFALLRAKNHVLERIQISPLCSGLSTIHCPMCVGGMHPSQLTQLIAV